MALFIAVTVSPLALRIAIAGAHGGLGREIVQQTIDRNWSSVAMVRRDDPIYAPNRKGWLEDNGWLLTPQTSDRVSTHLYGDEMPAYDALVVSLGGRPFERDSSAEVLSDLVGDLPQTCKKVCLVSAFGVGDSLKGSGAGIEIMSAWYLRDVYASKRIQERIVSSIRGVDTLVLRPRVLSYSRVPFNPISTTREDLARKILTWIDDNHA